MTRTAEDWAANLLADTSPEMLLVWADVLEEAEGPACEGVRELLVKRRRKRRPSLSPFGFEYEWWFHDLPEDVWISLKEGHRSGFTVRYRFNPYDPASQALAHYTALHDAATAYASMPEKWKRERRERVKQTKENEHV